MVLGNVYLIIYKHVRARGQITGETSPARGDAFLLLDGQISRRGFTVSLAKPFELFVDTDDKFLD